MQLAPTYFVDERAEVPRTWLADVFVHSQDELLRAKLDQDAETHGITMVKFENVLKAN